MKWYEVKIKTTSDGVDEVCNILYDLGVGGVSIEDPKDIEANMKEETSWDYFDINSLGFNHEGAIIKGYFPESEDFQEKIEFIKKSLNEISMKNGDDVTHEITTSEVYEEDWANSWKKYYKPKKIGEKIVVKPTWEEYSVNEGEKVVELDPGMAFGTGTHETTTMCTRLLEKYVDNNSRVFDIGCGSGILSIVAAKLGAAEVIGVDIDKVAYEVAVSNVKLNSVENTVNIKNGNLMDVVNGRADIVVANIIADIIILLAKDIKTFMKKPSHFIASGIILDRVDDVTKELINNGLEIVSIERLGEWAAIVSREKAGDTNE